MVAADGDQVTVTGEDHHGQLRAHHLYTGGPGQGATVDAVEHVGLDIDGDTGRAAHAADVQHLLGVHVQLIQGLDIIVQHLAAAASGAEEVRKFFLAQIFPQGVDFQLVCHVTSSPL